MDEPVPELRIGDRERRATDAHLQQAHADGVLTLIEYDERAALCWAARTQKELDELVRDLPPYRPGPDEQPTAVVAVPESGPSKSLGQRLGGALVAVAAAGGLLFIGSQVVTAADGVAVFGDHEITVPPGQDRVEVGVLFGDVKVVVPEGLRARTTGTRIFGSTGCTSACIGPGPEVVVDATGAFGSVDVVRPGELTDEEVEEAREEAEDAAEEAREDAEEQGTDGAGGSRNAGDDD